MKFSSPQPPAFTPIQITLESPGEVAAIFTLLNHAVVSAAVGLGGMDGGPWERLKDANAAAGNSSIDYEPFHIALERAIGNRE